MTNATTDTNVMLGNKKIYGDLFFSSMKPNSNMKPRKVLIYFKTQQLTVVTKQTGKVPPKYPEHISGLVTK